MEVVSKHGQVAMFRRKKKDGDIELVRSTRPTLCPDPLYLYVSR